MRGTLRLLVVVAAFLTAACGPPAVDLTKGIQILDRSSGWQDLGLVNGQNKLAPSVTFALKNVSDQTLGSLQVNALFRQVTEKEEWGASFVVVTGAEGLAPGATTSPVTIVSPRGYTGSQSRQEIMQSRFFIDAKVEIFVKYGSVQWTRLGEFPVTRQLLAK